MIVGMTYDLKAGYVRVSGDPEDASAEFDSVSTVQVISDALVASGHETVPIGGIQ